MMAGHQRSSGLSSRAPARAAAPSTTRPTAAAAASWTVTGTRRVQIPAAAPAAAAPFASAHRRQSAHAPAAAGDAAAAAATPTPAPRPRVLIAPAFYLDASVFRPLCKELRARGYDAVLVPIRWYMWQPTLGGRSQRPILDRLDWALEDLCAGVAVDPDTLELPSRAAALGGYGWREFLQEMLDPSKGARPLLPPSAVPDPPLPASHKAAVVASSAAGWIARILLAGERLAGGAEPYGGRSYEGASRRAHTLVTLGTPHFSSEPVTKKNIDWVNAHAAKRDDVRFVAVGAGGVSGRELFPGTNLGDFAFESYKLCAGDGTVDGDGVTPVECALALEGAEALVRLDGAAHNPPLFGARKKADWYGEGDFLEAWVGYLTPPPGGE